MELPTTPQLAILLRDLELAILVIVEDLLLISACRLAHLLQLQELAQQYLVHLMEPPEFQTTLQLAIPLPHQSLVLYQDIVEMPIILALYLVHRQLQVCALQIHA